VVRALAQSGVDVIAIGRNQPHRWVTEFLNDVSEQVIHGQADLSQPSSLRTAVGDHEVDVIVHAAVVTATLPQTERDEALRIVSVNIGGTMEALDLARVKASRRFVYVSSPSAIGNVESNTTMDEGVSKRPTSLYGITKDASEELVRRFGEIHGLSVVSVRIAQPYGPGERATTSRLRTSPIYEWLLAAEAGEPLITGPLDRGRDWTYIDDTANVIATLSEADILQYDLYHVGLGESVSIGSVVDEFRKTYPDIEINADPSHPDLNPNIASSAQRKPLDTSRFRAEFEWSPQTGIEEGMSRYLNWWRERNSRS
jgi:nucleoside-diphosphate-sugar epimerase